VPVPKGTRVGGRQKGTPNKLTSDIRAMVLGALEDAGGQSYLAKQAQKNPNAFLALVGKMLPRDIKAEVSGALTLEQLVAASMKKKAKEE